MAEYIPTALRGLLLHDARICEANRITTTSSAGPSYGTAAPDGTPRARVETYTGAADAAGGTAGSGYGERWIESTRAGTALPGQGAAQIAWSETDGGTQRGWMPPKIVTGFSWLAYESATLTYAQPHAITLQDGSLLVAYVRQTSGGSTNIRCKRTAPESTVSSEVLISDDTALQYSLSPNDMGPALVQLPDGRVLCFFLTIGDVGYQMQVAMSDDNGSTWTRVVRDAGGIGLASSGCAGLRVVYHGGYLTCLIQRPANQAYHYVSDSMGAHWYPVAADQPISARGASLLALPDGGCAMIYAEGTSTALRYTTKSGAFSPFNVGYISLVVATAQNVSVDIDNDRAYIASCVGQDGSIYVAFRSSGSSPGCRVKLINFRPSIADTSIGGYSTDLLWSDPGAVGSWDAEPLSWTDDTERMIAFALAPHTGGLRLISSYEGTAGALTGSLGMLTLGAWSSLTSTPATFGRYDDATPYGICYVPFIPPQTVAGWTRTGISVGSLTSTGFQQSFAGAAQDEYAVVGGASGYLWSMFTHTQNNGGSRTADDSFVHARCTDGSTTEHNVKIRFELNSARMVDVNNGNATLGSDLTGLTSAVAYDWQIFMNLDTVYVWYKLTTSTEWILWQDVVPVSASVAAAALFEWGTNATNNSTATWGFVGVSHYADPTSISPSVFSGITGRPLGVQPIYVSAGLSVRAARAPVMGGDTWQIPLAFQHGADRLDPLIAPSPRRGWRSTDTTVQIIAWDTGTGTTNLLSPAIGLHVSRPLARTIRLAGSPDNATWTTLIDIDCAAGMSGLTCSRSGDILTRSGGTTGPDYVALDELVGGWVIIVSAGTTYVREILGNEEGVWAGTGKPLKIRIDGAPSAPASGTLAIIRPAVTGVAWSISTNYRYYRIQVVALTQDAGSPGYLALGSIVIGALIPFGTQYSRGRALAVQHAQEVTTLQSGARSVRTLAPPRRAVEFAWVEGVDTTQVYRDFSLFATPDYTAAVNAGAGLATRRATDLIAGMAARQDGARLPVVYLPSLIYDAAGTTVARRDQHLYGRIMTDTFTRVAALGDEMADEIHTIGTVRIEEEV